MNRSRGKNQARTGQRNRRVTVVSHQRISDGMGGFTVEERPELTAWARVRRIWGTEGIASGALAGKQTVEVYLPASDAARAIDSSWVIVEAHTGRRFNIRDISLSEDRAEVMILCESGVPA